ncbi:MAG: redoxin domain-containing protein, partial [Chloroflexota bacterium]
MNQEQTKNPSGWGKIAAWLFVLGLLSIVALQLAKSQQGTVGRGEPAPFFVFTTFEGDEIASIDLNGKVIVLNFWASWCKPCEQEAAELQIAWEQYEPRGDVIFLGADYIDTDIEAARYI